MASKVAIVAAELAAAIRSGSAQASEAAIAHYDALDLDVDESDLDLGPIKKAPAEEVDES